MRPKTSSILLIALVMLAIAQPLHAMPEIRVNGEAVFTVPIGSRVQVEHDGSIDIIAADISASDVKQDPELAFKVQRLEGQVAVLNRYAEFANQRDSIVMRLNVLSYTVFATLALLALWAATVTIRTFRANRPHRSHKNGTLETLLETYVSWEGQLRKGMWPVVIFGTVPQLMIIALLVQDVGLMRVLELDEKFWAFFLPAGAVLGSYVAAIYHCHSRIIELSEKLSMASALSEQLTREAD